MQGRRIERLALTIWLTLCVLAPAGHSVLPKLGVAADHEGRSAFARMAMALPPFEYPWGMFRDIARFYRVPMYTDAAGVERVATFLLDTPSLLHKPSRVVHVVTYSDNYIGYRCLRQRPPYPVHVYMYFDSAPLGGGHPDWPAFRQRTLFSDVCARFER